MKDTPEFLEFQEVFKKYQTLFGLNGYKVYFEYKPLDCYAQLITNQHNMAATVTLDSSKRDKKHKNSKRSAKHEAIHLLTSRVQDKAYARFASENELYEAFEELVGKLEKLIPDIESGKE